MGMPKNSKPYPSDVSDEEWAFVAPYLALVRQDAPSAPTTSCARSSTPCGGSAPRSFLAHAAPRFPYTREAEVTLK
jgi:hypothetical protein